MLPLILEIHISFLKSEFSVSLQAQNGKGQSTNYFLFEEILKKMINLHKYSMNECQIQQNMTLT